MKFHQADVVSATNGAFGGCKWALYDIVCGYFTETESWPNNKADKYGHSHPYFKDMTFHLWYSLRSRSGSAGYYVRHECEQYCRQHGADFIHHFLNAYYHADIGHAIEHTQTFEELWEQLLTYFERRKEKFMAKRKLEIEVSADTKKGIVTYKPSQSHGGVANLLKVLTKTMEKQGADIKNIAKMQYAICKQAGIYIPDEFLTDVAVMLEVETGYNITQP